MKFEIWSEGYSATGEYAKAQKEGEAEGLTFKEACDNFAKENYWFRKDYNSETLTFWGCKLFADEEAAKKSFG